MIRLMVVDDEADIRVGICECVEWTSHGITLVGAAEDGEQAYEMIMELHPDIVLIDIQMPGVSGLDVIQRIRAEEEIDIAFIVLSGHDAFPYAKRALQLKVDEYLLKPCMPDEILQAVQGSIKRIQSIRHNQKVFDSLRGIMNEGDQKIHYCPSEEASMIRQLISGTEQGMLEASKAFAEFVFQNNIADSNRAVSILLLFVEIYRAVIERGGDWRYPAHDLLAWASKDQDTMTSQIYNMMLHARETLLAIPARHHIVNDAIGYVQENYASEINLQSVADQIHVSSPYLSTQFKKKLGTNFCDYVNRVRIEEAKKLLANSESRVTEIAIAVGYGNEKYFSRMFKQIVGITPTQYKAQALMEG